MVDPELTTNNNINMPGQPFNRATAPTILKKVTKIKTNQIKLNLKLIIITTIKNKKNKK